MQRVQGAEMRGGGASVVGVVSSANVEGAGD
jgi:hypothetical protein